MKDYPEEPEKNELRSWLIDQYLNGELPENTEEWLEKKMQTDLDLKEEIIAKALILQHFENLDIETDLGEGIEKISEKLKWKKSRNNKFWGLPAIYLIASAASIVLFVVWLGFRSEVDSRSLPFETRGNGFNMGPESIIVTFHSQALFTSESPSYHWQGDTLHVYGKSLFEMRNLDSNYLEQSKYRDFWTLHIGNDEFFVRKNITEKTPLSRNAEP